MFFDLLTVVLLLGFFLFHLLSILEDFLLLQDLVGLVIDDVCLPKKSFSFHSGHFFVLVQLFLHLFGFFIDIDDSLFPLNLLFLELPSFDLYNTRSSLPFDLLAGVCIVIFRVSHKRLYALI